MIASRFLAALAGIAILLSAPHFIAEFAALLRGSGASQGAMIAIGMPAVLLLSSGFFLVALAGPGDLRKPSMRRLAAVMLSLPVLVSVLALLFAARLPVLSLAAPLLGASALAFGVFIWPGPPRRRRYNRAREPFGRAPVLPKQANPFRHP